jgi:transcriptional regulator with XRE-family HTH domain
MADAASKMDRQWFDDRMRRRGLSLRSLAREIGLDAAALSKTLNGSRKMQVDEVRKIANALGEDEGVVLSHALAKKPKGRTPAKGAGTGRHPLFGCWKGMVVIPPNLDLTQPADPELADYLDKKYGEEWTGDR